MYIIDTIRTLDMQVELTVMPGEAGDFLEGNRRSATHPDGGLKPHSPASIKTSDASLAVDFFILGAMFLSVISDLLLVSTAFVHCEPGCATCDPTG